MMGGHEGGAPPNAQGGPPGSDQASVQQVVRFLAGESEQVDAMEEAVRRMARDAPAELARLRRAVLEEGLSEHTAGPTECTDVSQSLPDYLALGNAASQRMPAVQVHLRECEGCRAELELLREVAKRRDDWLRLSRRIGVPELPVLVLGRGKWQWLAPGLREMRPLSSDDVAVGRQVGPWLLGQRRRGFAFAFEGEITAPLQLLLRLPDREGQMNLEVASEYSASEHKHVWHFIVSLEPGSRAGRVQVALGDANRPTTGVHTVEAGRPGEFRNVLPPSGHSYWLHFDWKTASGGWQSYQVEVPLRADLERGDQ